MMNEWICAFKSPPSVEKRILAYSKAGNIQVLVRGPGGWYLCDFEFDSGHEALGSLVIFTHWMRLPEKPKL